MANLSLIFSTTPTSIDVVDVDAATLQTHYSEAEITDHPVEDGADVSDHSRKKPDRIIIEGLITNTPVNLVQRRRVVETLGGPVSVTTGTPVEGAEGRAEAAHKKLRELQEKGAIVKVVTRLRTYENMMLASLQFPQDPHTGDALRFSAELKQVRVVKNKVTTVTVTKSASGAKHKKVDVGKQAPGSATDAQKTRANKSILLNAAQGDLTGAGAQAADRYHQIIGAFQ